MNNDLQHDTIYILRTMDNIFESIYNTSQHFSKDYEDTQDVCKNLRDLYRDLGTQFEKLRDLYFEDSGSLSDGGSLSNIFQRQPSEMKKAKDKVREQISNKIQELEATIARNDTGHREMFSFKTYFIPMLQQYAKTAYEHSLKKLRKHGAMVIDCLNVAHDFSGIRDTLGGRRKNMLKKSNKTSVKKATSKKKPSLSVIKPKTCPKNPKSPKSPKNKSASTAHKTTAGTIVKKKSSSTVRKVSSTKTSKKPVKKATSRKTSNKTKH